MANEIRPEDVRRIAAQKEREVLGDGGIRRFAEPSFFPEQGSRRLQDNPYQRAAVAASPARGPYDQDMVFQQGSRGPYDQPQGGEEAGYDTAPAYADEGYQDPPQDQQTYREDEYADERYGDDRYGDADLGLPAGYSDGSYEKEGYDYDEAPRRRRWLPMTVALLALLGFGGVVWYAYDWGSTGSVGGEPPIIRADAGEEKVKPVNEGGIEVPNQETTVLNPEPEEPVTEVLMPPPEEPVAAPPPAPEPVEEPVVELVEATPSTGNAGPPAPPPEVASDGTVVIDAPSVQEAALPPAAPEPTPQPMPAPAPQIAAGDFLIQLASLRSQDAAERAWGSMQQAHGALLGDMSLSVQEADIEGKGKFYRVQAGPLPNRATADDMCARLKAAQQDCIVVRR